MKIKAIKKIYMKGKTSKLLLLLILFSLSLFSSSLSKFQLVNEENKINDCTPKSAAISYFVNLTNPLEVNGSTFKHGDIITVKGHVYNPYMSGAQPDVNVSIMFDGIDLWWSGDSNAKNITGPDGNFTITTTIPMWSDIYQPNIISINNTDGKTIQVNHHYEIDTEADSQIEYTESNPYPKTQGEKYKVTGYLKYDNGSGISGTIVYPFWRIDGTDSPRSALSTDINGFFSSDINLPFVEWNSLSLVLNFTGLSNINKSSLIVNNLYVFPNFSCAWDLPNNFTERTNVTIRGVVSSSINPSLKLYNRTLDVIYDGSLITSVTSNISGGFGFNFTIPSGNGSRILLISIKNDYNFFLNNSIALNVTSPTGTGTEDGAPVGGLFVDPVFIIALVVIIAGAIIGIYFYSKRQVAEAPVVKLPLEHRLNNLDVLKKSGRLEEAIVYLFYIFLELSESKYDISKDPNETINDYAIKCVKDMGQDPMLIYPFIKKIEKILYGSRGVIKEEDFKYVFSMFVSIFFNLTGVRIKI